MAWLLYENAFEDGTLTSTGDADGFPKENITDWRRGTSYRWKSSTAATSTHYLQTDAGSAIAYDTFVAGGHNQATSLVDWRLLYGATSTPATQAFEAATLTFTDPYHQTFSPGAFQYWRWKRDSGSDTTVPTQGIVTLGRRVDLDRLPLSVDVYGEEAVVNWGQTPDGEVVGSDLRYIRKKFVFNFDPAGLLTSTLDTSVPDFMGAVTHMRSKPIWFAPETDSDTDLVYLCRLEGGVSQPFVASTLRRNPTFTLVATIPVP